MSESKERSPQKLAKSRRDYPKGRAAVKTLDAARAAYIQLLGSLGSNAEVKAEVTRFREQVDQMQLQMLDRKPRKRPSKSKPTRPLASTHLGR